jgi:1A family penicillin-binding protein
MKKLYFLIKFTIFSFISITIIILGFYGYAYLTPKENLTTANQILIYDDENNLVFENSSNASWVTLDKISKNVIDATISAEDKNFYEHKGFDYLRILKAMFINIKSKSLKQGASTISQQYIKNLYLDFDKTWKRKIEEAFLTFELEVHYDKDDILEGYLNTINYGAGNYGIESAARYYFNKNSKDLTLAEASILVGIPKNPTYYNPINYFDNAKKRQKLVLDSMVNNKYITEKEANDVYNTELEFYGIKETKSMTSIYYYKDAVMQELRNIKAIPTSLIDTGGLKIYTNLNLNNQKILENNIKNELKNIDDIQVASIIVDPRTGNVSALVGGIDYNKSEFNRVTQAKRQVGSTMKPFLYYAALENGFTSSSTFRSEATTFNLGNDKTYSPKNAGNIYANKNISLASAIAFSDNIFAVKTHLFLGADSLIDTAKKVGIKTKLEPNASLPLGSNEISMIDFANGYVTLANMGKRNEVHLIEKVTDINNNVIYEFKSDEEEVLNKKYVYILNELLTNTYNYSFVDYTSPTMLRINNIITRKYAVKSGSTTSDTWTVGYNNDALVMVWSGYDDNDPTHKDVSIANKMIWAKTIEEVLKDTPKTWYEIPNNITASLVNPVSGLSNDGKKNVLLFYVNGTEPENNFTN